MGGTQCDAGGPTPLPSSRNDSGMCDLGSLTVSGNGAFLQLKVEPRSDRPRATFESSDGARSNAAALTNETTILLVAQKRCVRFVRWITSPPTPRCEVVCPTEHPTCRLWGEKQTFSIVGPKEDNYGDGIDYRRNRIYRKAALSRPVLS